MQKLKLIPAAFVAFAACHHFQSAPTPAPDPAHRWNASLSAPTSGSSRMNGTASMAPGPDGSSVSLIVSNGVPGSVHPWAVHAGQCGGADNGVLGSADAYTPIRVGADGRAMVAANVYFMTPSTGSFFVSIKTSATNMTTTVACGDLVLSGDVMQNR